MADIEICGVSKTYRDGTRAVESLDLIVRDGELLVLVGPSGSGKSTTLRLIAGLEEPTTGTLRMGGHDLRGVPSRQRNIAMVFQGLGLLGHLTARENLRFGLRLRETAGRGWLSRGAAGAANEDERVAWGAKLLGIEHLLHKRPAELSGGEQQRVAIGRALVRRPAAFLLDEPLANLDPPTRLALRREIRSLQRELGTTAVYVTHDQAEALALGDRIAAMHRGRLQQVGVPDELYRRPRNRFVASLFGSQGMSFLDAVVVSGGSEATIGDWRLAMPATVVRATGGGLFRRVVVGVRPEDALVRGDAAGEWSATVESIEYQGDTTYAQLRLTTGEADAIGQLLTVRCDAVVPVAGTRVGVSLKQDKLCWFDATTGDNLAWDAETAK